MSFMDLRHNFNKMIVRPLKQLDYNISFSISTYSSPIQHQLFKITNNIIISPIENFGRTGYTQRNSLLKGLSLINDGKFNSGI